MLVALDFRFFYFWRVHLKICVFQIFKDQHFFKGILGILRGDFKDIKGAVWKLLIALFIPSDSLGKNEQPIYLQSYTTCVPTNLLKNIVDIM